MTYDEYEKIAKCVRRRGTLAQRKALKSMMLSTGWDITHGRKLEIVSLRKQIAELQTEGHLLRLEIRRLKKRNPQGGPQWIKPPKTT